MQEIKFVDSNYEDNFMGTVHEEYERTIILFPENGKYFDKDKFLEEVARTIYCHKMESNYPEWF